MDNYRGITVTSILGKLFETVLLNRLDELNNDQSNLQFGFIKGLSPTMAALILSEAVLDSALTREPLYIAALDTQKAFDVVSYPVLMKMLHLQGINSHLWQVIRSMYSGLSARVKWEGGQPVFLCSSGCTSTRDPFDTFLQNLSERFSAGSGIQSPWKVHW